MALRVLVVDDDRQIVRLIRSYLEESGYSVLTAYEGKTALHIIRRERPDLVILDLMLPEHDGWDITRRVRSDESLAATPIIMLTARVEDTDKIIGLELGADDYITKPFNPREVVARVRAVLRRAGDTLGTGARVLAVGDLRLDTDAHQATQADTLLDLTVTEFNLLKVFMQNPGRAFTRMELIEQVFGYTYDNLDRTVDSHIKNLRKKIEPDSSSPTYILTVYGVGYRLWDGRT
ncbi:MAG: response regulator transcription factor [Anaerolineaceae bacterium]|nr:response regulator transcription factor [Anaerolineaceae bacterium]